MKILFCVSAMGPGGAERVVSVLSNYLSVENEVTILCIASNNPISFYELGSKVEILPLYSENESVTHGFKRVAKLKKKINLLAPDVVISFLPEVIVYTSLALIGSKVPLIVSERNDPKQYSKKYQFLCKVAFSMADAAVFQTDCAMNFYRRKRKQRFVKIFNPVFVEQTVSCLKEKVIVSVGRLTPQKNFKLLIDSFNVFCSDDDTWKLEIFGNGPLEKELKEYASKTKRADKISFMGNRTDWHDLVRNASLFVLSSDYEGMPNALLEALCMGLPCAATNCPVGGPEELSHYFPNLVLCDVGNVVQLSNAMKLAVNLNFDKVEYDIFSPKNVSEQWLKLIKELSK